MKFAEVFAKKNYRIILALVAFILYGNTLTNGYGLDDEFVTGPDNFTSQGIKSIPRIFKSYHVIDESGNNYEYRPIVKVSFAIEHQFFGMNLVVSHLMNVLLYICCLLLLLRLLNLLFKEIPPFVIFTAVLIFAILPVHAEVVVSLKNRDILLCFIFTMLGFISVIKFNETKKWYLPIIIIICFVLAFLSKFDVFPFIIIVPFVLYKRGTINLKWAIFNFVILYFSLFSSNNTKRFFIGKAVQQVRYYNYFESPLLFEKTLVAKTSAALNCLGFYIKMLIFPDKMASYYGYNTIPVFSFTSFFALLGLIGFVGLAYVFFTRFRKTDLLWYGVVFFGLSISMYLNFVIPAPGIVADRFMFFASIGFCLICVYFLFFFKDKPKQTIGFADLKPYQKIVPCVFFIFFAFMIINRNKEWKSKAILFEADVKKYPESVKLSLLTTSQLIISLNDPEKAKTIPDNEKLRKIRDAEELLKKAIKTDSSCGGCYNNLSFMYLTYERNPSEALPYLKLAYKRDSTRKELACNIGISYFRLGQTDIAEKFLLKAVNLDEKKDFSVPFEVLQDLYSRTNIKKGIEYFKQMVRQDNRKELMNVLLAKTYFEARDTASSIFHYKEALRINPNNRSISDFVTQLEVKFNKKNW